MKSIEKIQISCESMCVVSNCEYKKNAGVHGKLCAFVGTFELYVCACASVCMYGCRCVCANIIVSVCVCLVD